MSGTIYLGTERRGVAHRWDHLLGGTQRHDQLWGWGRVWGHRFGGVGWDHHLGKVTDLGGTTCLGRGRGGGTTMPGVGSRS